MSYTFKTVPYAHQQEEFRNFDKRSRALFWEQGTGKTKAIIDQFSCLIYKNKIQSVIIVTIMGIHRNWIIQEIPRHMPDAILNKITALTWSSSNSIKFEKELKNFIESEKCKILAINFDAIRLPRAVTVIKTLLKNDTFFIIDESSRIKSPKAKRTKALIKVSKYPNIKYKRILSGTPITRDILDIYTQFEFLDEGLLGFPSYYAYKSFVCQTKKIQMTKADRSWQFEKILGFRNLDKVKKLISPYTKVLKKEDCLDLPPKIHQIIQVELSQEQSDVYKAIQDELVWIAGGDINTIVEKAMKGEGFEDSVITENVLTQLLRLREICCGFITMETGKKVFEENPKCNLVLEEIELSDEKIIVWGSFVYELKNIYNKLIELYGKSSISLLYGQVKEKDRHNIIDAFMKDSNPRILVANPAVAGVGIDLFKASINIYLSNSFNAEHRWQSENRTHRIGQAQKVLYKDFICSGTIEEDILKNLKGKKKELEWLMST